MFRELYQYRQLLKSNVKKDIRGKYKGSFLGILWSFFNPLLTALVYAIVFPFILKSTVDHYITFLVIGILPWTFFTTMISQGTYCILANAGIIKKVYFPREILPISIAVSGVINFLISCLIILIFLFVSGIGVSIQILWLPLIIFVEFVFGLAIIFMTSAINVYIRDAEYIVNFIVNMVFYGTPILYTADLFTKSGLISTLIYINPMTTIINCYRDILFYQSMPHIKSLLFVLLVSLLLLYLGYKLFKRLERGFAEEV